jgi:hypothetical protein
MKNKKELDDTITEFIAITESKKDYEAKVAALDVRKKELTVTIGALMDGNMAIRLSGKLIKFAHIKQQRLDQAGAIKEMVENNVKVPMTEVKYDQVTVKLGVLGEDCILEGPVA